MRQRDLSRQCRRLSTPWDRKYRGDKAACYLETWCFSSLLMAALSVKSQLLISLLRIRNAAGIAAGAECSLMNFS